MTRIAVFAYSETGYECLKFLLGRGENVVLVVTHADVPGEDVWFPSVAELARSHAIPTVIAEAPDAALPARLREAAPDLLFSFYFRYPLSEEILKLARRGAYNLHGSLLPKYRGRAPVNWAVAHGETQSGATLHAMTQRIDAGDIVDQEAVPIGPDDTAFEVQKRVTQAGVKILERRLSQLKAGTAPARPQDEAAATTFPRRKPEDGRIDWTRPAEQVHNLVRAVAHPYPGAFTDIFGGKTTIWRTRLPHLGAHDNFPGQVRAEQGRLYVACGDDRYVEILRIQREGQNEIDARHFLSEAVSS
ncbi:MAG TPA: formyltransferase [Thermoanaerobaculia bacterium]|nr:formyltransferase [Thermoanaerobaculia bacterium]